MKKETIINVSEIKEFFKEYCDENNFGFSEQKFDEFLRFLEIDFYDWLKESLKHFYAQK